MAGRTAVFALLAALSASATELHERANLPGCVPCDPQGWTSTTSPAIGDGLSGFYGDMLASVAGIHFRRSEVDGGLVLEERAKTPPICCAEYAQCLLIKNRGIPFCYDKFTTNFVLPDGASGNLNSGAYTSTTGSTANLLDGNFAIDGTTGNIYTANPAAKPNTATLAIPPLYTASGVGSAIPLSALGGQYVVSTYTGSTVIPGTTVAASTVAARTVSGSVVIPATTVQGTTVAARTITGATTLTVSAVSTETVVAAAASGAAAGAKSAAWSLYAGEGERIGKMVCALGVVGFFAVFAL